MDRRKFLTNAGLLAGIAGGAALATPAISQERSKWQWLQHGDVVHLVYMMRLKDMLKKSKIYLVAL